MPPAAATIRLAAGQLTAIDGQRARLLGRIRPVATGVAGERFVRFAVGPAGATSTATAPRARAFAIL